MPHVCIGIRQARLLPLREAISVGRDANVNRDRKFSTGDGLELGADYAKLRASLGRLVDENLCPEATHKLAIHCGGYP